MVHGGIKTREKENGEEKEEKKERKRVVSRGWPRDG